MLKNYAIQYSFSLVRESGKSSGVSSAEISSVTTRLIPVAIASRAAIGSTAHILDREKSCGRSRVAVIEKPWTCTLEFARLPRRGENVSTATTTMATTTATISALAAQGCRDGLSAEPVFSRDIRHMWLSSANARAWTSAGRTAALFARHESSLASVRRNPIRKSQILNPERGIKSFHFFNARQSHLQYDSRIARRIFNISYEFWFNHLRRFW